ncbi:hypothetical protein HOLleu_27895 [Holothuria leucospilota]|uniref:Reverse transcriptase zinc-binding domain-containing protein n=1 Tax=Holothuria leucospilota TaxID=206669 RepID=A0A9Q1H3S8_HOLLE|nr:hypothetical protein HOLleu_27895 [Holothuria leucospilota]
MISLASLNCNGLINSERRHDLFSFCVRNKYDIILLQETFWDTRLHNQASLEWSGQIVSSCYNLQRSKGVCFLTKKDSDIELISFQNHIGGRLLQVEFLIDEVQFTIFNIYAPNVLSDRRKFFIDLKNIILKAAPPFILAGDFNNVLNCFLDKYPPGPRADSSRKPLLDIMFDFDLYDVWRELNPKCVDFTRTGNSVSGRTASRIDRFVISTSFRNRVQKCSITPYPYSDHSIIELVINFSSISRGKGTWIFNNILLSEEPFCVAVSNLIDQMKSHERYETDFLNWYDDLKCAIKSFTINYATSRQRVIRSLNKKLKKDIQYEKKKAQKFHDYDTTRLKLLEDELQESIFEVIKAISVDELEDTTFFISYLSSITHIFNILKQYEKSSGSKCNKDKTELLCVGTSYPLPSNFNFPVRNDFIKILGVVMGNNSQQVENENWNEKTPKCCAILEQWKGRNISLKGKALVINSLVISRLVYLASILPTPKWVTSSIGNVIVNFLWNGKVPRISYSTLALPVHRGGLNICDLDLKRDVLRIKVIAQLLRKDLGSKLTSLMVYFLNHYERMKLGFNIFRIFPDLSSIKQVPPFYQEMLLAWRKISDEHLCPPVNRFEILSQPIFHNRFITNKTSKPLFCRSFIDGEIVYLNDVMYEFLPSRLPSVAILESILLVEPNMNIELGYVENVIQEIINAIPSEWLTTIFESNKVLSDHNDDIPILKLNYNDDCFEVTSLTTKRATDILRSTNTNPPKGELFWNNRYPNVTFSNRWENSFKGLSSNWDCQLNFFILHNTLYSNEKLHKFGLLESPSCTFCNLEDETLFHLFIACPVVNSLWICITNKLKRVLSIDDMNEWIYMTLLGVEENSCSKRRLLIDFVLTTYKKTLWNTRFYLLEKFSVVNIEYYFYNSLKKKITFLYHVYKSRKKTSQFWEIFANSNLFDNESDNSFDFLFDRRN